MSKHTTLGSGYLCRRSRKSKPYGNWLLRLHEAYGVVKCINLGTTNYDIACQRYRERDL